MVIYTNELFIPIPSNKTNNISVIVGATDTEIQKRTYESKWTIPLLQYGIGGFTAKISDSDGSMATLLTPGTVVKFYADHDGSSKLQFWGRVDYPKKSLKKEGKYLDIVGRHRSFFLNERKVCHTAELEDPGRVLKDICDKYATEVGQTGITTPGTELLTCDTTTGWSVSYASVTTSSDNKRGTYALNMINNGGWTGALIYKATPADYDITSSSIVLWIKIGDQDTLDSLGNANGLMFQIWAEDTDGSDSATWNFYKEDFKVGWNRIICTKGDLLHEYDEDAGMDITACNRIRVYNFTLEAIAFVAGQFIVDDIWIIPTAAIVSVDWNYKPFTECVKELADAATYDARIGNDLDIDFFERNSILSTDDAVVESDNYIDSDEFGQDDYYTRTRVTVEGQDDSGLPIFYTAISGVDDSEDAPEDTDGIREVHLKNTSANTIQKVKDLAVATLATYVGRPAQGSIKSHGLQSALPGDNIWVVVPRQQIYSPYRIVTMTHSFGVKAGPWKTDTSFEEELKTTDNLLNIAYRQIQDRTVAENVNKMNFTYNVPFDDDTLTTSHSNTKVQDGKLVMIDATLKSGTWKSINHAATQNITKLEMRWKGKDLGASKFYYSTNGGLTWTQVTNQRTLVSVPVSAQTRSLQLRVDLEIDAENTNPELDSTVGMYG